ncbi:MAG: MBL fold metallo-hydrolase [Planctomycetota bacterium]|jgi:glyoxylase-like metal-dependent hydrolase (beta-lactamase superfamily II)
MRLFSSFLVLIVIVQAVPAQAQNLDKIKIETIKLSEDVYMLASKAGGNLCASIGEDGIFLVDSEYAGLNDKVRAALEEISEKPVKFVFNTHWHFDHVGGNESFAKGGGRIVAHENVRMRMAEDRHIGVIDVDVPASPDAALPVLTFTDTITFHLENETIKAFHPENAHTDGDGVVVFHESDVIHTGDIVFFPGYPFIDVTNGGNINGVIAAVDAILERCSDNTRIIPGHGPLMSKADLESYGKMLRAFRDVIAREMAAGKDLETIQAERPTKTLDEKWGRGSFPPDKFRSIVFLSLDKL